MISNWVIAFGIFCLTCAVIVWRALKFAEVFEPDYVPTPSERPSPPSEPSEVERASVARQARMEAAQAWRKAAAKAELQARSYRDQGYPTLYDAEMRDAQECLRRAEEEERKT